jgi:hypothetical protein
LLAVTACSKPLVLQGTVVSYDTQTKILIVTDERAPNRNFTFSIKNAEIGVEPAPGDLVRLAYRDQGGTLLAHRVMNMTRQKEIAGSIKK